MRWDSPSPTRSGGSKRRSTQEELDPAADFGLWSEVLESLRWLQRLLAEAEQSDGVVTPE